MCHRVYDLHVLQKERERETAAQPKPRIAREPAFTLRPLLARLMNRLKKQPSPIRPLKQA